MFHRLRKAFDPAAPAPARSYRFEAQPLPGGQGTEYTLYGPPGHEGLAHDWFAEHILSLEEIARRRSQGAIKFRYICIEAGE